MLDLQTFNYGNSARKEIYTTASDKFSFNTNPAKAKGAKLYNMLTKM